MKKIIGLFLLALMLTGCFYDKLNDLSKSYDVVFSTLNKNTFVCIDDEKEHLVVFTWGNWSIENAIIYDISGIVDGSDYKLPRVK